MKQSESDVAGLTREWIRKAEADLEAAERLAPQVAAGSGLGEIVGFHCQQAAEKYIKALLTHHQVEFPKTHDLTALLALTATVDRGAAEAMGEVCWLTPFGVEARYPGDAAEMLPGEVIRAIGLARAVKATVTEALRRQ